MNVGLRPFPNPVDPDYEDHFNALARGELVVRRCAACAAVQWPPRATCAACGALRFEPHMLAPQGEVYTFSIVHRAFHPWFADRLPYGVAIVEVGDGVRLAGLYEGPLDVLQCGLWVTGSSVELGGAPALVWRPETSAA